MSTKPLPMLINSGVTAFFRQLSSHIMLDEKMKKS